jgi:hypothetical protein
LGDKSESRLASNRHVSDNQPPSLQQGNTNAKSSLIKQQDGLLAMPTGFESELPVAALESSVPASKDYSLVLYLLIPYINSQDLKARLLRVSSALYDAIAPGLYNRSILSGTARDESFFAVNEDSLLKRMGCRPKAELLGLVKCIHIISPPTTDINVSYQAKALICLDTLVIRLRHIRPMYFYPYPNKDKNDYLTGIFTSKMVYAEDWSRTAWVLKQDTHVDHSTDSYHIPNGLWYFLPRTISSPFLPLDVHCGPDSLTKHYSDLFLTAMTELLLAVKNFASLKDWTIYGLGRKPLSINGKNEYTAIRSAIVDTRNPPPDMRMRELPVLMTEVNVQTWKANMLRDVLLESPAGLQWWDNHVHFKLAAEDNLYSQIWG